MTDNCIIRQIEEGRIPEDYLCVLTPMLARQKDPVAADLLIHIDRRRLWQRWGFAGMEDYITQADVPEAILRCVALTLMIEELDQPYMLSGRNSGARQAVVRLCGDGPFDISHDEFSRRRQRALALLESCRRAS